MTTRPNSWAPALSVLLVFVAGLWLAMQSSNCAILVLVVAGTMRFSADKLDALDADVREAAEEVGGITKLAAHLGMDGSDLVKVLKGSTHRTLDVRRIDELPDEVQRVFYFARLVRLGLPARAKAAAKIAPFLSDEQECA